ncbi:MAG: DUF5685 family protein [Candidatus Coproplasma sp.]
MFGYTSPDKHTPKVLRECFRKRYCLLCHALGKFYGQKARLTVSYDVSFFTLFLGKSDSVGALRKIKCFRNGKQLAALLESDGVFKKTAALNLTLAAAELQDNIADKDGAWATLAYGLFRGSFKKIQKEYPGMWKDITEGYAQMAVLEKGGASLEEMEESFAEIIRVVVRREFEFDEQFLPHLIFACKMLYFLDAVDDLDKDLKKGKYNPLSAYGSRRELVDKHYNVIEEHMQKLYKGVSYIKTDNHDLMAAQRIVFHSMVDKLVAICMRSGK